jgi:DNA-binding beta-propeller fold protein YncE
MELNGQERQETRRRLFAMARRWLGAAFVLIFFYGCAAVDKAQFTELFWPEPPLTPRIKFVGLLRSQADLGRGSGELFMEALLGPKKIPESLAQPMALASSQDGTRLYITDYAKPGVLVFDFTTHRVSTLGGEAHGFKNPLGIAVDDKDNVYVVDSTPKLIRVFDRSGKFIRNITHDSLERPTGIAIDVVRRRLYVADSSRRTSDNHVIRIFDLDGNYLKHFGGQGSEEGKFFFPTYLALDGSGDLYVTDTMNARVQIFDAEGRHRKTIGERGDAIGMFDKPKGVALDSFGNIYVVDSSWSNVQIFNQKGQVLLFFASRGRFPGLLFNPTGIAIDKDNRIYIADAFNRRVAIYQLINTKAEDSFIALPTGATTN